jgi:hypothetical protein
VGKAAQIDPLDKRWVQSNRTAVPNIPKSVRAFPPYSLKKETDSVSETQLPIYIFLKISTYGTGTIVRNPKN